MALSVPYRKYNMLNKQRNIPSASPTN